MTEKMPRTVQETIRITYCGGGLPKQQRRAANEPSTNANMFGGHAEPDFTAKDVVQLTLDNAWALQHIVQGNVKVHELILSKF